MNVFKSLFVNISQYSYNVAAAFWSANMANNKWKQASTNHYYHEHSGTHKRSLLYMLEPRLFQLISVNNKIVKLNKRSNAL